ncbi:MAG: hypothetical protein IPN20_10890 [Haliscomenobacter sp.]|nr:hypothetical protein [Haliscomenobacter sp.]
MDMLKRDQWTGMLAPGPENRTELIKAGHALYADVQFGQPSIRCRGSGICTVDLYQGPSYNQDRAKCARAIGMVVWREEMLYLVFSKYAICRHLAETYFEKGKIRLHEPVRLSHALCERLGIAGLELPKGVYKVTKEDPFFCIGFPALSIGTHLPQSAWIVPDVYVPTS